MKKVRRVKSKSPNPGSNSISSASNDNLRADSGRISRSPSSKSQLSDKGGHILKSGAAPPRLSRKVKHYEKLTIARQAAYATESARRDEDGKTKKKKKDTSISDLSAYSGGSISRDPSRDNLSAPTTPTPDGSPIPDSSSPFGNVPLGATFGATNNAFLPGARYEAEPSEPGRKRTGKELWQRLRELWFSRNQAKPAFLKSAHPVLRAIGYMLSGVKGDLQNRIYRPGGYRGTLVECTTLDALLIWRQVTKYVKDLDEKDIDAALVQMVEERGIVAWKEGDDPDAPVATPYWQQGNLYMYTSENLAARISLKADRDIKAIVKKWWILADSEGVGYITQERYREISKCVYKALMPTFNDLEADNVATEEWRADVEGSDVMDEATFLNSIFEIADLWCASIDKGEYIFFLRVLFRLISKPDGSGFRDLDEIESQASGNQMPKFREYAEAEATLTAPQTGSRLRTASDSKSDQQAPSEMPHAMSFLGDFYSNQLVAPGLTRDSNSLTDLMDYLPEGEAVSYMKVFGRLELHTIGDVAGLVHADIDQFPQREALKTLKGALERYSITVTPPPQTPGEEDNSTRGNASSNAPLIVSTTDSLGSAPRQLTSSHDSRNDSTPVPGSLTIDTNLRREDSMDSVDLTSTPIAPLAANGPDWEQGLLNDVRSSVLTSTNTLGLSLHTINGLADSEIRRTSIDDLQEHDLEGLLHEGLQHGSSSSMQQGSLDDLDGAAPGAKPRRRRRRRKTRKDSIESADAPGVEALTKFLPKWGPIMEVTPDIGALSSMNPDDAKSLLQIPSSVMVSLGSILETGHDLFALEIENQTVPVGETLRTELSMESLPGIPGLEGSDPQRMLLSPDIDMSQNPIANLAQGFEDVPIHRLLPYLTSDRDWRDDFEDNSIRKIGDLVEPDVQALFVTDVQIALSKMVTKANQMKIQLEELTKVMPETAVNDLLSHLPATANWRGIFRERDITVLKDLPTKFDMTQPECQTLVDGLKSFLEQHVLFPQTAGSRVTLETVEGMLPGMGIMNLLEQKGISKLHHLAVLTPSDLRTLSQQELEYLITIMDHVMVGHGDDEDVRAFYQTLHEVAGTDLTTTSMPDPRHQRVTDSTDSFHLTFSSSPPRMQSSLTSNPGRSRSQTLQSAALMPADNEPVLYPSLAKNSAPLSRLFPFLPEIYRHTIAKFEAVGLGCIGHLAGLEGAELAVAMEEFGMEGIPEDRLMKIFRRSLQGLVKSGNARMPSHAGNMPSPLDSHTVFTSRQSFARWKAPHKTDRELKTVDMMSNLSAGLTEDYNARGRRPRSSQGRPSPIDIRRGSVLSTTSSFEQGPNSPGRRNTLHSARGLPSASSRRRHNSFAGHALTSSHDFDSSNSRSPRPPSHRNTSRRPKSPLISEKWTQPQSADDSMLPLGTTSTPPKRTMRSSRSDYGGVRRGAAAFARGISTSTIGSDENTSGLHRIDEHSDRGSVGSGDSASHNHARHSSSKQQHHSGSGRSPMFHSPGPTTPRYSSRSSDGSSAPQSSGRPRTMKTSQSLHGFHRTSNRPALHSPRHGGEFTFTELGSDRERERDRLRSDQYGSDTGRKHRSLGKSKTTLGISDVRRQRSRSVSPISPAMAQELQGQIPEPPNTGRSPQGPRRNTTRAVTPNINILPPNDERRGSHTARSGDLLPPIKSPANTAGH